MRMADRVRLASRPRLRGVKRVDPAINATKKRNGRESYRTT